MLGVDSQEIETPRKKKIDVELHVIVRIMAAAINIIAFQHHKSRKTLKHRPFHQCFYLSACNSTRNGSEWLFSISIH